MFPKPVADLAPNSLAFETVPLVKPTGFREYDARWWFGRPGAAKQPELNLMGVTALGLGIGTLLHERGIRPDVVVGHDFRAYSSAIKMALTTGLMAAGCRVHDIGMAVTPMAYFAQFALDVPAVAMVTASHNENGWTGVKMGCERPITFGPDEMGRLKEIVLTAAFEMRAGGAYDVPRGHRRPLHGRSRRTEEVHPSDQGGRRLRQRHRRRLRAQGAGGAGGRGRAARYRARPHLPALQSQSGRPGDAARHQPGRAGIPGRYRPRLRR